ncbi:MAG TPA: PAS domain-containing sensor histidine kinase [Vicinamibacterales bacterium]|nr:PAS domain-containing sensor histidine kinase [Vicinamibacterales bacterium]
MPRSLSFPSLFQRSPNSYMVLDRQLRFVAANDAYLQVTGKRLDELIGRNVFDEFPHDPADPGNESAALLRQSLERVLATGRADVIAFIRYRVPRAEDGDGRIEDRFWSATHAPIHDEHGEVAYILQHTVDVTELQRLRKAASHPAAAATTRIEAGVLERAREVQETNQALQIERANLQRLFEQAPGFMAFLSGPTHVFEIANAGYYQLVGHREIIGKTLAEALPELENQLFIQLLDDVFTTGKPFVGTGMRALLQQEPGAPLSEVFLNFSYQPILDPSNRTTGILVLGHDITRQKIQEVERAALFERERAARAEAEAARDELHRRAEFDKQLIGIVSHDLRNPMNAIGIATSLLLKRGQLDEQSVRVVKRIMSSSDRAVRLIQDFLDFTQARVMGRIPMTPKPANIRELARQVFDEVLLTQPSRKGTIVHDGEADGMWDPDRLAQVIGNLLSNAFQHSPPSSTVCLTTRGDQDGVTIDVHNEGPPISPDDLARLFEPFERGTDASASGRSIGLGLYISRQIIEAHGGTIEVRSVEGEGTRFRVWLPQNAGADSDALASSSQFPVSS